MTSVCTALMGCDNKQHMQFLASSVKLVKDLTITIRIQLQDSSNTPKNTPFDVYL